MSFKSFLSKHAHDLGNIASAFESIVFALPLGAQDKQNITNTVDKIKQASTNVANAAAAMPDATTVGDVAAPLIEGEINHLIPDSHNQAVAIGEEVVKSAIAAVLPTFLDELAAKVVHLLHPHSDPVPPVDTAPPPLG